MEQLDQVLTLQSGLLDLAEYYYYSTHTLIGTSETDSGGMQLLHEARARGVRTFNLGILIEVEYHKVEISRYISIHSFQLMMNSLPTKEFCQGNTKVCTTSCVL